MPRFDYIVRTLGTKIYFPFAYGGIELEPFRGNDATFTHMHPDGSINPMNKNYDI